MKITSLLIISLLLACGSPKKSGDPVVVIPDRDESAPPPVASKPTPPPKPKDPPMGAVTASFQDNGSPLYAYVKKVNKRKGGMTIAFEGNRLPQIEVREGQSADLSIVTLKDFSRPLLLVNAQLKDPDFRKYHLYVWKDGSWLQPIRPWAVHLDHSPNQLETLRQDRAGFVKRYYSVFDLDTEGDSTYTWRLLEEEVPVRTK